MIFLSTLSLRRATLNQIPPRRFHYHFYPRSPCGERPVTRVARTPTTVISIHALLAESDINRNITNGKRKKFLSTLSLRRATASNRTERPRQHISIHALLAESDRPLRQLQSALRHFYPRSPCGERLCQWYPVGYFGCHFYPRSPCGERRSGRPETRQHDVISIHALLAESDNLHPGYCALIQLFLSTLSLRRATKLIVRQHGLLRDFYPRSPCGERQISESQYMQTFYFYPRSPCGERQRT